MIGTILDEVKVFILNNKKIVIAVSVLIFILLVPLLFTSLVNQTKKQDELKIASHSENLETDGVKYLNINAENGFLYKAGNSGRKAAEELISKNPKINGGVIFPESFKKQSEFNKEQKDNEDVFLKKRGIEISNEHYFYAQKINGVPVYGGQVIIHLKNKNEIYSVTAKLLKSEKSTTRKIEDEKAKEIALKKAGEQHKGDFSVGETKEYIFNPSLMGISEESINYLTLAVNVYSISDSFSKQYFVDLESGKVVYEEDLVFEVLDRGVGNCGGSQPPCSFTRVEGSNPIGDSDVDSIYDFLGDTYNYFYGAFNRDSLDNTGSKLKAYVTTAYSCPNAFFSSSLGGFGFCPSMGTLDILAHEFTHGVTHNTARLIYESQSGTLNESVSDVFASEVDGNWTLGEGSALGIIRDMSNPPSIIKQNRQPDSLFSSHYYCASPPCSKKTNDLCGVHINSGVFNKAYFLMVDGGGFNGCSISGIGREKASSIVYYALTRYLTNSANFRSMYSSILQSCTDLYGVGADCDEVKKALQATEMDQQPSGQQQGAGCIGQARQVPECAGGAPLPTDSLTPFPTVPVGTTPIPTSSLKTPAVKGNVYRDFNGNGQMETGEGIAGATVNLIGTLNKETLTDSAGGFNFEQLLVGDYKLSARSGVDTIETSTFNLPENTIITATLRFPVVFQPTPTSTSGTGGTGGGSSSGGTGGGSNRTSLTPSPTPYIVGDCVLDPNCFKTNTMQLCTLKCTPR